MIDCWNPAEILPVLEPSDVQSLLPEFNCIRLDSGRTGQINGRNMVRRDLVTATEHCWIPTTIARFCFSPLVIFSYEPNVEK
jgi:hypothetical protein